MARVSVLLLVALLAAVFIATASAALTKDADGWYKGRATFYTDNGQGSCKYGSTHGDVFYAAWPDTMEGFPACGTCWEVKCEPSDFKDGFGQPVKRATACYDADKTVVVKVRDSCPCIHQNWLSNQHWCCGDAAHIDLSDEVFKMLAPEGLGVVGAAWRSVSCDRLGQVGSAGSTKPESKGTPTGKHSAGTSGGKNGKNKHNKSKHHKDDDAGDDDEAVVVVEASVSAGSGGEWQLGGSQHSDASSSLADWVHSAVGWRR